MAQDLHTVFSHLYGQTVGVNGNTYPIDNYGVVTAVADADAAALLQITGWLPIAAAVASGEVPSARPTIVTDDVNPIPPGGYMPTVGAASVQAGNAVWPDPSPDMDVTYLRQMCDYYSLPYTIRTFKSVLVSRLQLAMYPMTDPTNG